mmetsp:Transcript_54164/g.139899  ORF Transcript_54164/g.139899 Transcript_54164/m.139899 type:complete len:102 (-) Transcript_54164:530-835(-)
MRLAARRCRPLGLDAAEAELPAFERGFNAQRGVDEPSKVVAAEPQHLAAPRRLGFGRSSPLGGACHESPCNPNAIPIGSDEQERELRTGRYGYLHHACKGM